MERRTTVNSQKTSPSPNHFRGRSARVSASSHPILQLQQSIGNHAVQRFIQSSYVQTKLQVSTPGDRSELEADRVADTILRMPQPDAEATEQEESNGGPPLNATFTPVIQRVPLAVREDDEEEERTPEKKHLEESERINKFTKDGVLQRQKVIDDDKTRETETVPIVRRQLDEENEQVQTKLTSGYQSTSTSSADVVQRVCTECEQQSDAPIRRAATDIEEHVVDDGETTKSVQPSRTNSIPSQSITDSVAHNISALNGSGSPLPANTRAFFEPRFGADLSQVRVHTDSRAAETTKSLQARAFTVGKNIAFANGEYAPESHLGKRLLAHELAHVMQQNGRQPARSFRSADQNTIFRAPTPKSSTSLREPVELKGRAAFDPPKEIADDIKGNLGNPVSVAVKFGDFAIGEVPIIWNGLWYDTGPPPPDHDGHPLPIHDDGFPLLQGARPVLAINIERSIVTGFVGWRTSAALSRDPAGFFNKYPLSELFGWKGLKTTKNDPSQLAGGLHHGRLLFQVNDIEFEVADFTGSGAVELRDEKLKVDLGIDLDVKGMKKSRLPLQRDDTNRLFAGKTFNFDLSFGKAGDALRGQITGSFGNGTIDVRGTVRYTSKDPKITGSLTVIITDFETAKENVRDKLGADAPADIKPADPGDRLAITGWGELDFALSEWLTGNAEVILHPEGYVTARGEIVPTKVIPLFKRRAKEQELIGKKSASMTLIFIPVWGDVSAEGSVGPLVAHGSFGAGTLHDLRVAGLVSNHPAIVNRFELSGVMSSPATAGLTLEAAGEIHAKLLHTVKILSAGVEVKATLQLNMLGEAGVQVGRRAGPSGKPEYYIEGDLKASAELILRLLIMFHGNFLVWRGHIEALNRTFGLGSAGVKLHFVAAIDKDGESRVDVDFGKVAFDPDKFLAAVVRSETVEKKGYKGETEAKPDTTGELQPGAPIPPDEPEKGEEGRNIPTTLRRDFTMFYEHHLLILRLTSPPRLEMSTDPPAKPLRKRTAEARAQLKKDKDEPEKVSAQLTELNKIDAIALQVEEAAAKAAVAPTTQTDIHTPGFTEAADELHDYGDRFQETDLAAGIAKPSAPKPSPDDPPKGSSAQLALAKQTFGNRHWVRRELQDLLKVSETTAKDRISAWKDADQLFELSTSPTDPLKAYNFDKARSGDRPLKDTESNRSKYGFKNPPHDSRQGYEILAKGIRPGSKPPSDPASRYDSMRGGKRAEPPSKFVDFPRPLARLGHGPIGASEFWNDGKPVPGHKQSYEQNRIWNLNPDNYWGPEHKDESDASGGSTPRYRVPMKAIGSHDDWTQN